MLTDLGTVSPSLAEAVLIVSATFPPRAGSGVQRVYCLAENLAESGWGTWVVTEATAKYWVSDNTHQLRHLDKQQVVRVPQYPNRLWQLSDRLLKKVTGSTFYPDEHAGWWKPALRAAAAIVQKHRIKYIICSVGQPSSLRVGFHLKRCFPAVKVVVDLRDLWAGNPVRFRNRRWNIIDKLDCKLEARWLPEADAIVTVSKHHAESIQSRYPEYPRRRVYVVPNGFDEHLFQNADSVRGSSKIIIRYLGFLLPDQKPEFFFQALATLTKIDGNSLKDVQVETYGGNPRYIRHLAEQCGVTDLVLANGYVDHRRAVSLMKGADILLLFWTHDPGCMCGKLYEYLRSNRFILGFDQGNLEARDLVVAKGRGTWVPADNVKQIASQLQDLIESIRRGESLLPEQLPDISELSRQSQAQEIAGILSSLREKPLVSLSGQ